MPSEGALAARPIPVLLLKTKSAPSDSYEEQLLLSALPEGGCSFEPFFVPVFSHRFKQQGIDRLRTLIRQGRIGMNPGSEFGGMIFTSQRAIEAFATIFEESPENEIDYSGWTHVQNVPIYTVGPATTRALGSLPRQPPLHVFGGHTGNGDALAQFILPHYAQWYRRDQQRLTLPPLLFPVGEQRRDVIPRKLMDELLPADRRIRVSEEVVYETSEMQSFPTHLEAMLDRTQSTSSRWIVVFSPLGCESLLRGLGMLDVDTGRYVPTNRDGRTFVVTIGPTTRDFLVHTFGFEPDVCAETPTPAGVIQGIISYETQRRSRSREIPV